MLNKVFSYVTTILLFISFAVNAVPESNQIYHELSILVSSCDKYSQLWQPFFKLLDKNWPELKRDHKEVKVYLLANKKTFNYPGVEMINIPQEISWSDNMLFALNSIKTKYVLLFLDDYWVSEPVNVTRFEELLKSMYYHDAAYMQLHVDPAEQKLFKAVARVDGLVHKNKFQKYRASLQLAIWEVAALKQILRSGENPWEFEMAASIRSSGYPKDFLTLQKHPPFTYINASYQGHITPAALELAQSMIPNYTSTLPVLKENNWDLKLRGVQHRMETFAALVKRNLLDTEQESYRYLFESRE